MRNILFGVVVTLVILFTFKYCDDKNANTVVLKEHSALIQEQLKNVGKLIVTEGHFSEVFNYKDSKAVFNDYFTSEKKALVVVNADVSIAYDLSKITYKIDEENKILLILTIPDEELKIYPDFEYYDVQSGYFNTFEAEDYNKVKGLVTTSLMKKINASEFKKNAKNRLISELAKFYILTNSLGWTLQYNESTITAPKDLEGLKL
ncbi:DUF4230 domain-containing protein [Lacinutrix undariae]